jgi:hypothetical protein
MLQWIGLFLKLLPLVLAIIREIQRRRLTAEATAEVIADLNSKAEALATRAIQARLGVDHSEEAIANDPDNRDRV